MPAVFRDRPGRQHARKCTAPHILAAPAPSRSPRRCRDWRPSRSLYGRCSPRFPSVRDRESVSEFIPNGLVMTPKPELMPRPRMAVELAMSHGKISMLLVVLLELLCYTDH